MFKHHNIKFWYTRTFCKIIIDKYNCSRRVLLYQLRIRKDILKRRKTIVQAIKKTRIRTFWNSFYFDDVHTLCIKTFSICHCKTVPEGCSYKNRFIISTNLVMLFLIKPKMFFLTTTNIPWQACWAAWDIETRRRNCCSWSY